MLAERAATNMRPSCRAQPYPEAIASLDGGGESMRVEAGIVIAIRGSTEKPRLPLAPKSPPASRSTLCCRGGQRRR